MPRYISGDTPWTSKNVRIDKCANLPYHCGMIISLIDKMTPHQQMSAMKMSRDPISIAPLTLEENRVVSEHRANWVPWIPPKEALNADFIEIVLQRWSVRGLGAPEPMRAIKVPVEAIIGLFELPNELSYFARGGDVWAASAFGIDFMQHPIGSQDKVTVIGFGSDEQDGASDWRSLNHDLLLQWQKNAPVDNSGRTSPMDLCEYLKTRDMRPSEFAWRQALHHQQSALRAYDRVLRNIHVMAFSGKSGYASKWEEGQSLPSFRDELGADGRIELMSSIGLAGLYLSAIIEEVGMFWLPHDAAAMIAYIKSSQRGGQ